MDEKEKLKELFKSVIDSKNSFALNMLFVSMISADSNTNEKELKENLKSLEIFVEVLGEYPKRKRCKELKEMSISYINQYKPKEK